MPKQMDVNDLLPSEIKSSTRLFVDEQYKRQYDNYELPPVRNRHEGYGLLAEAYQNVKRADDNVKLAMSNCLRALAGTDGVFQEAASDAFNSLLDACIATVCMGVQTLNVIYKIQEIWAMNPTPMEEMAADAEEIAEEDELPDVPDPEEEEG